MILGCVVALVGVLGIVFRHALAVAAIWLFSASGIDADQSKTPAAERVYLFGGVFMVVAGVATVVYALVTPRSVNAFPQPRTESGFVTVLPLNQRAFGS